MKIVVCYKNVPDVEKIKVSMDRNLDFSETAPTIGQYDLNALEAACELAAQEPDAEIIALTVAGNVIDNTKQRKAVLSRGADKMLGVKGDLFDDADTYRIAATISDTVKEIGGVDLLLFGEGSADMYAQQTGPMTGAMLGWPNVNAVSLINYANGYAEVSRELEESSEQLRVKLPAVLSVTSDINKPHIPSMKDILAAGKKPIDVIESNRPAQDVQSAVKIVSVLAPETKERRKKIYDKISDEAIDAVLLEIKKIV